MSGELLLPSRTYITNILSPFIDNYSYLLHSKYEVLISSNDFWLLLKVIIVNLGDILVFCIFKYATTEVEEVGKWFAY